MTGETEVVEDCGHPILDTIGNMAVRLMELTRERDTALKQTSRLRDAVEAVLMFHSAGPWDTQKLLKWDRHTGCAEATTKGLCDVLRKALEAE